MGSRVIDVKTEKVVFLYSDKTKEVCVRVRNQYGGLESYMNADKILLKISDNLVYVLQVKNDKSHALLRVSLLKSSQRRLEKLETQDFEKLSLESAMYCWDIINQLRLKPADEGRMVEQVAEFLLKQEGGKRNIYGPQFFISTDGLLQAKHQILYTRN